MTNQKGNEMNKLPETDWKCLKCGQRTKGSERCECAPSWHDIATELCTDGCIRNDSNVERASKALQTIYPAYDDETALDALTDVLTDLRHLCDLMGWDFAFRDGLAHKCYLQELADCGIAKDDDFKAAIKRDLE